MAGWKKYFKTSNISGQVSPIGSGSVNNLANPAYRNFASSLPEVYVGHPNRVERYNQYEQMDMDSEVNAALDILAEFCTQKNDENLTAFDLHFHEKPTDNEVKIIKEQLQQWVNLNELNKRIFKIVRNTIKYGDQVFIRDPETFQIMWTEMSKVVKVIVNEGDGKKPEQYVIKDLNPNFQNLTVTAVTTSDTFTNHPQVGGNSGAYVQPRSPYSGGSRFSHAQNEAVINAEHVVHLSLTEGLDVFWPFGNSVLENIFKVFKQKELLEDAMLIYRVQRAPERRMFKIDVGNMPSHMAMAFVERVKNEMHQRRIPTYGGGGQNIMDSSYNPLSINEDFFFPVGADGRGSSVEMLQGGQNLGEIDDLKYFNNKMARGLRVPSSYLPTGPDDSDRTMQDGKVGTALIQEYRFNQYCERLQALIMQKLDDEFKMFLRWRGFNIDAGLFQIKFNPPQNFASYRQAELDTSRITAFTSLEALPYMSKRFLLERFLGLTEDEIQTNSKLWKEERSKPELDTSQGQDLRSVGITPAGLESDVAMGQEMSNLTPAGQPGEPGAAPGGTIGNTPAAQPPGAGAPIPGAA